MFDLQMKTEKKPDLETLLAILISDGAREIEVECDHGEWWVSIVEENTAVGVIRYSTEQDMRRIDHSLDRLRKEKSISVNGRVYRLSFKYRENFFEPSWRLRVSEKKDQKSNKSVTRRRGKPHA